MGSLLDMQNTKYRFILDLIKNEESYDKRLKVISGLEAFHICQKRYELLKSIFNPLKTTLGNNIVINSIIFNNNMQDETSIAIKYVKNDKLCMMAISLYDLEPLEVTLSDLEIDSDEFFIENHDLINKIISELAYYDFIENPEILLKSCSKKIIINDNCNDYIIKLNDEKSFSIGTNHFLYDRNKKLFVPEKINSDNSIIKEELMNEEAIQEIYKNIRIDAEDFPKELVKKIS